MSEDLQREHIGLAEKLRKRPLVASVVIVLVIVATLIGMFFVFKALNVVDPLALKVGEREVSQTAFNEYVRYGEAQGLDRNEVRDIVIEYEKNLAMADKYNIVMPDEYVTFMSRTARGSSDTSSTNGDGVNPSDLAKLEEAIAGSQNEESAAEFSDLNLDHSDTSSNEQSRRNIRAQGEDNALNAAIGYSTVFNLRLAQSALDGYGVFVYEFAAAGMNTGNEATEQVKQTKTLAAEYRKKIIDKELGAAKALEEVIDYGAANARNDFSGAMFVVDEATPSDDGSIANVRSSTYLLQQVKKYPRGVSELIETDANSVFFMNVLFEQKKRDNLRAEIAQAKESTRVVVYDR